MELLRGKIRFDGSEIRPNHHFKQIFKENKKPLNGGIKG